MKPIKRFMAALVFIKQESPVTDIQTLLLFLYIASRGKTDTKALLRLRFEKSTINEIIEKLEEAGMVKIIEKKNRKMIIFIKKGHEFIRMLKDFFLPQKKCEACRQRLATGIHHWLPIRDFDETPFTINLCDICHREIEDELPDNVRLSVERYARIIFNFVQRKQNQ